MRAARLKPLGAAPARPVGRLFSGRGATKEIIKRRTQRPRGRPIHLGFKDSASARLPHVVRGVVHGNGPLDRVGK